MKACENSVLGARPCVCPSLLYTPPPAVSFVAQTRLTRLSVPRLAQGQTEGMLSRRLSQ